MLARTVTRQLKSGKGDEHRITGRVPTVATKTDEKT